ncbi:putative quinol monooxygenase [Aquimarina hainanensis]|uniref:Quinol monooxygenase n=1 Tax=Aquimarina hainanensis TaxID=1578017 RepID=A0ABW5N1Y8_9FLAO|nr:antibiotic biosynthesis monooxygenase [Aquimarina sp. TRL1]QKX04285.1 carboxymuconolactone decarboxylase [Aquimarina sp. TRL1]
MDILLKEGYFITAEIKIKDLTKTVIARRALSNLQKASLMEAGCSLFSVQQVFNDPSRFILRERFDDEEAFKKHFEYSHTKYYLEQNLTEVVQYFQMDVPVAPISSE